MRDPLNWAGSIHEMVGSNEHPGCAGIGYSRGEGRIDETAAQCRLQDDCRNAGRFDNREVDADFVAVIEVDDHVGITGGMKAAGLLIDKPSLFAS